MDVSEIKRNNLVAGYLPKYMLNACYVLKEQNVENDLALPSKPLYCPPLFPMGMFKLTIIRLSIFNYVDFINSGFVLC